jgi:F-type H+-transporting ATPase subunit delta
VSMNRTDAIQISRRYATAMFDLAVEAKKEKTLVDEFSTLANAIATNAQLAEALANPTIHHSQKAAVLHALVAKGDAVTKRAVAVIAEAGRADLIPTIAEDLQQRLAAYTGEIEATVTSARTLTAATQKQLVQSLAVATGKSVKLKLKEDASVLGGLRIELGSLRLDATLAGALNNMREQLLAPTN